MVHKMEDYIQKSIDQLEQYPEDWLSLFAVGYQSLRYGNQDDIVKLGKIGHYYLSRMTISKLIKLGEQFGSYTSLVWSIDWKDVDIKSISQYFHHIEEYESLLIMGCFHPSGYFREKCINLLAHHPYTLSLIMLRMNDWVEEIQSIAYQLTYHQLLKCSLNELIQVAYVYIKLRKSQRRSQTNWNKIENIYKDKLKQTMNTFDIYHFMKQDIYNRKAFYLLMNEENLFSNDMLEQLVQYEKDTFCLLIVIRKILNGLNDLEKISSLLTHRSFYMRKEAYIRYYEIVQDVWGGIENGLLDKSYSIRDYVRYIIRKHTHMDILNYYLNHLECPEALLGVGECGSGEQVDILLPYLESYDEKMVKAVLQSLSRLMTYRGSDIYWRFLLDERIAVSKVAYLAILRNKVHYGADFVYEHYLTFPLEHHQRYLLCILLEEDSWERLPYLLMLYWYPDRKMRHHIQMKVNQRNPYKKVSHVLKERIISCLNDKDAMIPADVKKLIMFDLKFVSRGEKDE